MKPYVSLDFPKLILFFQFEIFIKMFINLKNKNILIIGCGGGYDIFCGLVLYFDLIKDNRITLSSFSFTNCELLEKCETLTSHCYKVNADLNIAEKDVYFPEYKLSQSINELIYAIPTSVDLDIYEDAVRCIVKHHQIDTIIVVDGGCDSLLFGQEEQLATPVEDMMTIYIINKLIKGNHIHQTYVTCLGTTVELIDHMDFEKSVGKIKDQGGLIACHSLREIYLGSTPQKEYIDKYIEIFKKCDTNNSIINSSVVSAIEGHIGKYENPMLQKRISMTENFPNLSEKTALLWIFDLPIVAQNVIYLDYLDLLKDTDDIDAFIMYMNDQLYPANCKYCHDTIYGQTRMNKIRPLVEELLRKISRVESTPSFQISF